MNTAIIPAAGQGRRMGTDRAKQFLELGRDPVIVHTLRRFDACPAIDAVVVVVPAEATSAFLELASRAGLRKVARVVTGGAERHESVARGLAAVRPEASGVVVIHDAVRPFVTPEQIGAVVARAAETGAALLGLPATDTVKEVEGGAVVRTLDRSRVVLAQTPQAFRYDVIRSAHERARREGWATTDDASVVERCGHPVAVVEGSPFNIKITRAADLPLARFILSVWEEGVREEGGGRRGAGD
jgi:2-C-methyl-D-erythritol 4-phosphate cytidylyltransferase